MKTAAPLDMRLDSVEELLALAEALERQAAARYRGLSARMNRQGDTALATQFEALARMEDRHAGEVADRAQSLLGRAAGSTRVDWELPPTYDEDEARGAALGAYQALAFAVRNEERAFAFYTYVAAAAEHPDVRALAETLAREELEHASILRRHRRRAFRSAPPIAIEIPDSVEALLAAARRWDREAATAHATLAKALEDAGERADAATFRSLAVEEEVAAAGAVGGSVATLRSAADGLRLLEDGFDRYALIGERSNDEGVVAEAQRLAGEMVARLALAGGARNNALLRPPAA
jgi:rubrerythrin